MLSWTAPLATMMNSLRRGQIVRVRLDPVVGSEQGGERPALVISSDAINRMGTVVIVAAITSRKTERIYPFEALLEPPDGGLTMRSKVSLVQLRDIDARSILGTYGQVSAATMARVEEALRIATGLRRV